MRSAVAFAALALAGCDHPDADQPDQVLYETPKAVAFPTIAALGTEPFWSVIANKGTLAWTSPEEPVARPVPAKVVTLHGGWNFTGELDGSPFELTVGNGQCSDGMSDTVYPMFARVKKGGLVFNGCAREGLPKGR